MYEIQKLYQICTKIFKTHRQVFTESKIKRIPYKISYLATKYFHIYSEVMYNSRQTF